MKIAIPTYNRFNIISFKALKAFDLKDIYIFVNNYDEDKAEEAMNEYAKNLPEGFPIENLIQLKTKGIPAARNGILNYFKKDEEILMLDDDVETIQRLEIDSSTLKGKLRELTPEELKTFVRGAFQVCRANYTKLWGVYPVQNAFYMKNSLSNKGFIIGTFFGVINSDIRYDERQYLKEDYDFTIKHLIKYKKVVRYEDHTTKADHYRLDGGCVEQRKKNTELEKYCCDRLLTKYPTIVKRNPKRENEVLIKV